LPILILVLLQGLKDHTDWAWDQAHEIRGLTSLHGECFSRIGLSIGENANTEAIQCTSHDISNLVKNIFLCWLMTEYLVEFEFNRIDLLRLSRLCPLKQRLLVSIEPELVFFAE
jgi:hypothetical protein